MMKLLAKVKASKTMIKESHKVINMLSCIKIHKISPHNGNDTARTLSKYGVFSSPYFPIFGLNTEIYGVNHRIQSEYRKIRTRKNYLSGYFSRRVNS